MCPARRIHVDLPTGEHDWLVELPVPVLGRDVLDHDARVALDAPSCPQSSRPVVDAEHVRRRGERGVVGRGWRSGEDGLQLGDRVDPALWALLLRRREHVWGALHGSGGHRQRRERSGRERPPREMMKTRSLAHGFRKGHLVVVHHWTACVRLLTRTGPRKSRERRIVLENQGRNGTKQCCSRREGGFFRDCVHVVVEVSAMASARVLSPKAQSPPRSKTSTIRASRTCPG